MISTGRLKEIDEMLGHAEPFTVPHPKFPDGGKCDKCQTQHVHPSIGERRVDLLHICRELLNEVRRCNRASQPEPPTAPIAVTAPMLGVLRRPSAGSASATQKAAPKKKR